MEVNVREARSKISALLDKTMKAEEVTIIRRGRRVARLVPMEPVEKRLPDLGAFRSTISNQGEPLSKAIIQGRNEDRYWWYTWKLVTSDKHLGTKGKRRNHHGEPEAQKESGERRGIKYRAGRGGW